MAALARAVNDWARARGGGTEPPSSVHHGAHGDARAGAADPAPHRPWRVGSIDCQPPYAGRDARRLAAISRDSGVALACVTGFHLARYYPAGVRPWSSAAAAADLFEREVATGLTEAPSRRAGAIKAAHGGNVDADLMAWEAAVEAQRRTGATLLVHTERGAGASELFEWLLARGVPPERVYLCHMDKRPDVALHAELAGTGALLGYDTFLRPQYQPERNVWPLLLALVERGLWRSVAVCLDLAAPESWRAPNTGPAGFVSVVAMRLAAAVRDQTLVSALLGGNVVRALALPPQNGGSS